MNVINVIAAVGVLSSLGSLSHGSLSADQRVDVPRVNEGMMCSGGLCVGTSTLPETTQSASVIDTVVPAIYGPSLRYGIDTTDSPCDDLYGFVNDGWRKQAVLPAKKQPGMHIVTFFDHVNRSMRNRLTYVLDSARTQYATAQQETFRVLGEFYESCMVADTLESAPFKRRKTDSTVKDSTRAEQCLNRVQKGIPAVAGQYFAEELIRTKAVVKMEALLAALKSEVAQMLREHPIMNAEEKRYAIDRLDRLVLRVGIPKEPVDYRTLRLNANDYFGNKIAILNFYNSQWVSGIGGDVREKWKASLLMPNAMYLPSDHAIEIPTLMFSPPFFYAEGEDLLNFAGIGYVIGHEIFHSVTPQLHALQDTLMRAEIERFKDFNTSMGERDAWIANGKRTFNEDVADLGGGRVAYRAWKAQTDHQTNSPNTIRDGFTPDQRFFVALGRIWRSKWEGGAPNHDVHAPHFARVNATVMQIPEFPKAFGCQEGDPMYLAPDKLSRIW